MYCRKCGNKLLDDDEFCSNCGVKIISKKRSQIAENISKPQTLPENSKRYDETINNNFSMVWYKFFMYFRLPLGIISCIGILTTMNYSSFSYDKINLGIFILSITMIVLFSLLFYLMKKRIKYTMYFLIVELIAESASILIYGFNQNNIFCIPWAILWFVLNYIYFNKRKNIFVNEW